MTIKKQPDGRYKVIIELGEMNGKRKRHTKIFIKNKDAKDYEKYYESLGDHSILMKDFIEKWYENVIKPTKSINTINTYERDIYNYIIPYLGNKRIAKITTKDIQDFYFELSKTDLKAVSIKPIVLKIYKCLKYAYKLETISKLPNEIEYTKKDIKHDKIKYWTEDELSYFLSEIKDNYIYLPVMILAFTGIRAGELCGLQYKDINLNTGKININKQVVRDKLNKCHVLQHNLKTTTSTRTITMPSILINELSKCAFADNNFVITNTLQFYDADNLYSRFKKQVSKYDISQISIHDLRHTHATILLKNGENIKVISKRLGHSNITTTLNTYSHVMPEQEESTAILLDAIFKDKF